MSSRVQNLRLRIGVVGALVFATVAMPAASVATRPLLVAGDASIASGCTAIPGTSGCVTVVGSVMHVRPRDNPTGSTGASITAARNEFESFQLVVRAGASPLSGVTVGVGRLVGAAGTIPAANVTPYLEGYYNVQTPSDGELGGATGLFPDALVPKVDPWTHQVRSWFPFAVPANENRTVWFDVLVPSTGVSGHYSDTIHLTTNGSSVSVPLGLDVVPITLPSTSSLPTAYGLENPTSFCQALGCPTTAAAWRTAGRFTRVALENRISLFDSAYTDPSGNGAAGSNSAYFRRYLLPYLQSKNDTRLVDPNGVHAQLTSVGLTYDIFSDPTLNCTNAAAGSTCLQDWKTEAAAGGFSNRFFMYVCDEVGTDVTKWQVCAKNRAKARTIWPGLPTLTTNTIQGLDTASIQNTCLTYGGSDIHAAPPQPCEQVIDTNVAEIEHIAGKSGPYLGNQRPAYDSYLTQPGKRLWLYLSCDTTSCDNTHTGSEFNGWPSLAIDQPPSEARAMGWESFLYQATGHLYYEVAQSLLTAWTDQLYSGGNGDGTLFYPGKACAGNTPPCIGGTTSIPIESIRLKRLRDGQEDFEWLKYLSDHGQDAFARSTALGLFGGSLDVASFSADVPGAQFDNTAGTTRAQLAARIVAVAPPAAYPHITGIAPSSGPVGSTVTITGSNLANAYSVKLNGTSAPFTVVDANTINATVPRGATTGYLTVTNADGTGKSPTIFTVTQAAEKPGRLVFARTVSSHSDIFVGAASGSGSAIDLTAAATVAGGSTLADDSQPVWSGDGTKIAFTSNRAGNQDVWVMNADGSNLANLTTVHLGKDEKPAWSNDGTRIAYVRTVNGQDDIWVMNADGTNRHGLGWDNPTRNDFDPAWSPTDTQLAYATVGTDGHSHIFTANADGTGTPTNLSGTAAADDDLPSWNHTGTTIIFDSTRSSGRYGLYTVPTSGGTVSPLVTSTGDDYAPVYSPDDTYIAYTSTRDTTPRLYTANANGTAQTPLVYGTDTNLTSTAADWTN